MSNDLISRSALISHIESERRQWGEDYDTEQILGDIEDFPTAYDVDKVIEQIKSAKDEDNMVCCINDKPVIEKSKAIEIVKGGGVDA